LVEGFCCLFVILFAFGELGVVLLLLCLSVVSSLNLLSLSLSLSLVLPLSELVLVLDLASKELECEEALSSLWSFVFFGVFDGAAIDLFEVCCSGGKGGLLGCPLQEEEEEEKKKGKRERKGRKRENQPGAAANKKGGNTQKKKRGCEEVGKKICL
jgi:hypothetical protein